jgi:hypothetical protein
LIQTTLEASRTKGTLRVERELGWLRFEKRYSASEVSRIVEWETTRGFGLTLELSSGKKNRLTLFPEYSSLGAQAANRTFSCASLARGEAVLLVFVRHALERS